MNSSTHTMRRRLLGALPVAALAAPWAAPAAGQSAGALDELLAANRAFDEALSRLDIAAVEALSLQEAHAFAIHPGARTITMGWDAVRASWRAVAERFAELSVRLDGAQGVVRDGVGWVSGVEVVSGRRRTGEPVAYSALTTNLFERRGGRWLLSAHVTARVPG